MSYLPYISDADLTREVKQLLNVAQDGVARAIASAGRNKLDPFSALFEMAGFGISHAEWQSAEQTRQAQKTLSNEIGQFHQNILGCVPGWQNLYKGSVVDLVNPTRKLIAEVKNKYNTVKGSDKISIYDTLDRAVATKGHEHFGFTAYYVEIIPSSKKGYDKPFTPSDNKKGDTRKENERIRVIDGRSFYALATGHQNALEALHQVLPTVIEKCSAAKYKFADRHITGAIFAAAFGANAANK